MHCTWFTCWSYWCDHMSGANVAGSALNATRSSRSAKTRVAEDGVEVLERVQELDDGAQLRALQRAAAGQALVAGEHPGDLAVVAVEDLDHARRERTVAGPLVEPPRERRRLRGHRRVHDVLRPLPQAAPRRRDRHVLGPVEGLVVDALGPELAGEVEEPWLAGPLVDVERGDEALEPAEPAPVEERRAVEAVVDGTQAAARRPRGHARRPSPRGTGRAPCSRAGSPTGRSASPRRRAGTGRTSRRRAGASTTWSTCRARRSFIGPSSSRNASGMAPSSQYGARSHPSAVPPNHWLCATSGQNSSRWPVRPSAWSRSCRASQPAGRIDPSGSGRNAGSARPASPPGAGAAGAATGAAVAATPAATLARNSRRSRSRMVR